MERIKLIFFKKKQRLTALLRLRWIMKVTNRQRNYKLWERDQPKHRIDPGPITNHNTANSCAQTLQERGT